MFCTSSSGNRAGCSVRSPQGGTMLIWLSGELQGEVAKGYTDAMRHLRTALKSRMTTADYGEAVHGWAVIGIVKKLESPLYREGWQFNRRRGMAEFRLKLDYDEFTAADDA